MRPKTGLSGDLGGSVFLGKPRLVIFFRETPQADPRPSETKTRLRWPNVWEPLGHSRTRGGGRSRVAFAWFNSLAQSPPFALWVSPVSS